MLVGAEVLGDELQKTGEHTPPSHKSQQFGPFPQHFKALLSSLGPLLQRAPASATTHSSSHLLLQTCDSTSVVKGFPGAYSLLAQPHLKLFCPFNHARSFYFQTQRIPQLPTITRTLYFPLLLYLMKTRLCLIRLLLPTPELQEKKLTICSRD